MSRAPGVAAGTTPRIGVGSRRDRHQRPNERQNGDDSLRLRHHLPPLAVIEELASSSAAVPRAGKRTPLAPLSCLGTTARRPHSTRGRRSHPSAAMSWISLHIRGPPLRASETSCMPSYCRSQTPRMPGPRGAARAHRSVRRLKRVGGPASRPPGAAAAGRRPPRGWAWTFSAGRRDDRPERAPPGGRLTGVKHFGNHAAKPRC